MAEQRRPRDKNSLIRAGDVNINKVEMTLLSGETLDLEPFVVEINIYEDIFSPALTGNVVLRDAINLIGGLPLVGDEIITLDIETPGFSTLGAFDRLNKIQKSFSVYAIKNRQLNADREQYYTIHFCSLEAALDNVAKVSRKFSGNTDDIVLQIYEEFFKLPRIFNSKIAVDGAEGGINETREDSQSVDNSKKYTTLYVADSPHRSSISFVSPMWSPMKIINWLAKRTIGNEHESPTFLFYETTKAFYYTSIEALIDTQMKNNLLYSDFVYNTPLTDTRTANSLNESFSTVKEVKFLSNLDVLNSQDLGHFTNSVYTFDLIKKEHKHWIYDHGMAFNDYKHMESYKFDSGSNTYVKDEEKKYNSIFPFNIMRSYNTKSFMSTINPGVLDSTEESIDLTPEKFVGQRNSLLLDINTLKLTIDVPGRTDCEVGKLIRFYYPSVGSRNDRTTRESEEVLWDPLVSGFFLITALHHHITPFHHNMVLEIAKDSYRNALLEVAEGESTAPEETSETPQSSSPTNTQQTNAPPSNRPVGKGGFIGDSIAVGLGGSAKDAATNARVGADSNEIKKNYSSKGGSDYTVISMGSNDKGKPSVNTVANATAIRESVKTQTKKVIWILPYDRNIAQKIQGVASKYGDKVVDLKDFPSNDGLHPKSYSTVLTRVNQLAAS